MRWSACIVSGPMFEEAFNSWCRIKGWCAEQVPNTQLPSQPLTQHLPQLPSHTPPAVCILQQWVYWIVVAALLVAHTQCFPHCLPQAPAIIDTLNDAATSEVCSDVESWNVLPGEYMLCV